MIIPTMETSLASKAVDLGNKYTQGMGQIREWAGPTLPITGPETCLELLEGFLWRQGLTLDHGGSKNADNRGQRKTFLQLFFFFCLFHFIQFLMVLFILFYLHILIHILFIFYFYLFFTVSVFFSCFCSLFFLFISFFGLVFIFIFYFLLLIVFSFYFSFLSFFYLNWLVILIDTKSLWMFYVLCLFTYYKTGFSRHNYLCLLFVGFNICIYFTPYLFSIINLKIK